MAPLLAAMPALVTETLPKASSELNHPERHVLPHYLPPPRRAGPSPLPLIL